MLSAPAEEALSALATALIGQPELEEMVRDRWRIRTRSSALAQRDRTLPEALSRAADLLAQELPLQTHGPSDVSALADRFSSESGPLLLLWCYASTWRKDVELAKLLASARAVPGFQERVAAVAAQRVVEGPLLDALGCVPLLGTGMALRLPANAEARARLEILIWEAGASAREVPEFGRWLWASRDNFEELIRNPARGALRGRVLAARCLEISVCGLSAHADQELIGRALQTLQPLLLHPEPLVWVHASRALGRLTGQVEQLEGTLLDWVLGESTLLRQRALTAFASLPAARLKFLASQLVAILDSPSETDWALGAVAVATPYLFYERRPLWDRLAKRILAGDGGSVAARALARGLSVLWRRGQKSAEIEAPMRALRELSWCARPTSLPESRRWIEVTALTDAIDGAERDPLDLELGLENLIRVAAQYDDEEADARAARFATSLAATFSEARRIALAEHGRLRQRAAAFNALEGCARAFALRLWGPMLATRPVDEPLDEPHLEETWKLVARAPAEILDLIKERRQLENALPDADLPLEILAIRLGGYALDACGEAADLGPGRGPTAHDTCLWLRKLSGLTDGSRELPPPLQSALSALFWRLVDTTRGTALGEVDDVEWLGPFAAWRALVIDRPAMLLQLATALPMMAEGALARCCERAELLRTAVSSGGGDGEWGAAASEALESLHAMNTELSRALLGLSRALVSFDGAAGPKPDLEVMCLNLVRAGERLQGALADPVKALHEGVEGASLAPLSRNAAENAQRIAGLVARAIRARELSLLDVWFASLGPVASALLEGAVRTAIRRTPPPPPKAKKQEPKIIHGYELVKTLGEGGIGSVWLVRRPGADRLFVLKIPKAEALANATDSERDGILASFVEEARALAGLYHPNVANIIDRGVEGGMPFLVLEYLIGADLKEYSLAQPMSLFELRQVVLDSCAGLAALHSAGLVHRDIKPANIWLRLPLSGGERFDPQKHRDPARTQPLSAVVIDFGMVRAIRVPTDASGRFVAGTAGYIAPEQVLDPVELDPRSDVYSLAGTVYTVATGRAFFDEIENNRDRIIAHMRRDPLEDSERLKPFPAAIAKLLRAATLLDPAHRPTPLEFGKEFASAL
ncbi:MAG TPA: serine/threonine-protein kinase [Polyangiaceae bacterium]|nr:serine/threonine-protein kinase [Polyangiaceae bacterium]